MHPRGTGKPKNEKINVLKIRELCGDKGMSLAELARGIGLEDRQKINARLQKQNSFTGDELFLIADLFEVSVDSLRL